MSGFYTECRWCKKKMPIKLGDLLEEATAMYCSDACESAQAEHVRDLYDEGKSNGTETDE